MGVLRRIQILSNLCKDNLQVDSKVANGSYSLFSVWFVTVGNNLKFGKNEVGLNLFESQWELSTSLPSALLRGQETGTSNVNVLSITRGSGSPNFIQEKLSSFLSKNDCCFVSAYSCVYFAIKSCLSSFLGTVCGGIERFSISLLKIRPRI